MASDALAHVPGGLGLPVVGHTLAFLRDARGLMDRKREQHGDVFKLRVLGRTNVLFLTPEANRHIYLDPDKVFSSEGGWSSSIGPLFRNGLMLRDFEDHHLHRRVLQQAFRRTALEGYVVAIHRVIDRHLDDLGPGPVDIYRFLKCLTLDIAADVFVGASLGAQAQAVNDAFVAMMAASVTPLRRDLPGTPYRRGLQGRRKLDAIFGALVTERRARPEAADLLSRLSHAKTESGELLPAGEVVDHMVFLLLAAHDTTTATLAVMLYELARNPNWQQRVADEV
ncbi:MAG: cytochrome P450, partial [Actinomycetota bacterium]|nr:cytochrome P450 [Actinomycetota bacterium]